MQLPKRLLLIGLVLLMPCLMLSAQSDLPVDDGSKSEESFLEPYGKGDQIFLINGGLFIPMFFHFPNASSLIDTDSFESTAGQLSLGGIGSLSWSSFLSHRLFLGVDLSGTFALSPNDKVQMMLPLTMRFGYLFLAGSFEIPVSIEAGISMNKYEEKTFFGPIVKPAASIYWVANASWAFGLNMKYWWVPEIYFGDRSDYTAFGNFTELSLSARYRF